MSSLASKDKSALREVGRRIRVRRLALRLSQEALADAAGLHRTYIGSVERGERNVSLVNLLRISAALSVDVGYLTSKLTGKPEGS
jgi:transcriptional regulator with XRE-family HTH domain